MFKSCLGSNLTFGALWIELNMLRLCNFICGKGSSIFYFYANFLKQNCLHISSLPSHKAEFLSNLTEASVALWLCPLPWLLTISVWLGFANFTCWLHWCSLVVIFGLVVKNINPGLKLAYKFFLNQSQILKLVIKLKLVGFLYLIELLYLSFDHILY